MVQGAMSESRGRRRTVFWEVDVKNLTSITKVYLVDYMKRKNVKVLDKGETVKLYFLKKQNKLEIMDGLKLVNASFQIKLIDSSHCAITFDPFIIDWLSELKELDID